MPRAVAESLAHAVRSCPFPAYTCRMSLPIRVLAVVLPFLVACDSTVEPADGGGGGGVVGGSGSGGDGQGGGGSGGAVPGSGCPATTPADGQTCEPIDLVCEYDEGFVLECRPKTTCTSAGWETLSPNCSSDPPPDIDCPANQPTGDCDEGADPSLCVYGNEVVCGCSNCLGGPCGGQAQWVCAPPPAAPCPPVAPLLGAACSDEAVSCTYGSCFLSLIGGRTCTDGIWVDDDVACPL